MELLVNTACGALEEHRQYFPLLPVFSFTFCFFQKFLVLVSNHDILSSKDLVSRSGTAGTQYFYTDLGIDAGIAAFSLKSFARFSYARKFVYEKNIKLLIIKITYGILSELSFSHTFISINLQFLYYFQSKCLKFGKLFYQNVTCEMC